MKITKLGHCCLLIEEQGVRILTDPGNFTTDATREVRDIDLILITHEHEDHVHIPSLKIVLENNPNATIITNAAVGKLLEAESITYQIINDSEERAWHNLEIEAFDSPHALIYDTLPRVQNTGFMINNRLFYPGDALIKPSRPVEILAYPITGPWIKVSEAIRYALDVKPTTCIPVHDGMFATPGTGANYMIAEKILTPQGIRQVILQPNEPREF